MPPKKSILLVDDEPEVLETTKWAFEMNGYQVFTAKSGEEGLECIKTNHPRVLLIDYKLPKMSGIELLKEARALDPTGAVIIITGLTHQSEEIEAECKQLGAFAFLRKPLQIDAVLQAVKEALTK